MMLGMMVEKVSIDEPGQAFLRQPGIGMSMHGRVSLGQYPVQPKTHPVAARAD
jgi:hypothetical protein